MVRFIGLDVHKRVVQAAILDASGKLLAQKRFLAFRSDLESFAKTTLTPSDQVVLEATTNCWEIVSLLTPHVKRVVVSNPLQTKAIAYAKVKTDKVDARTLAELLRCSFLPEVWPPDERTRLLRSLTGRRTSLVHQKTMIKNRIHAVLHQRLVQLPEEDLFCKAGMEWLSKVEIDQAGRQAIVSELRLFDSLMSEVAQLDQQLACLAYEDPRIKLVMTLPGVDVSVASAVVAALGDIHRFRSGNHAASYLGLVPSTRQSADHCYHGPITKRGNSKARWMLTQAAHIVSRHAGPLGVFFRRVAKKKNWNVAVTATARKLAVVAWFMLKNNEPYRYAMPATIKQKMSQLRVKATGQRRKPGARTTAAGDQVEAPGRAIPSLAEVYESEGLPSPKQLSEGERQVVEKLELIDFIHRINTRQRILRTAA